MELFSKVLKPELICNEDGYELPIHKNAAEDHQSPTCIGLEELEGS